MCHCDGFFVVAMPRLWHGQVVSSHFSNLHSCIKPTCLGSCSRFVSLHCHMQMSTLFRSTVGIIHAHSSLFLLPQQALHLHYWLPPTSSTCLIWRLGCCKVGWGVRIACKGVGRLLTSGHSCQMRDSFIIVFMLQMDGSADRQAE